MALPPVTFARPQQSSPIEEAFGIALATAASELVKAPFERRRARRELSDALTRQTALNMQRLSDLPRELDIQNRALLDRMKQQAEQEIDLFPRVAAARAGGRIAELGVLRGAEVEPATDALVDRIRELTGGIDTKGTLSLAEYDQIAPLLGTAVAAGNLDEERKRTTAQQESQRDIRLANLLPPLTGDDIQELGSLYIQGEGPISYGDLQLLRAGERVNVIAANDPSFQPFSDRLEVLNRAREEGRLIQVGLTRKALQETTQQYSTPSQENAIALNGLAMAYPMVAFDSKGKKFDVGESGTTAAFVRGNADLLQALSAIRFARSMEDVIDAEKTSAGARLTPRALGYLSLIFKGQGRPWQHPQAEIPTEIPEEVLRSLGLTRLGTGTPGSVNSVPGEVGPESGFGAAVPRQGRGPLFTVPPISSERPGFMEYENVRREFYNRMRQRKQTYETLREWVIQNHTNAEKADSFYADLGLDRVQRRELREGPDEVRRLKTTELLNIMLQALQDVRDNMAAGR